MKFVINGGSGYIGYHIAKDLVEKGHSVLLFDILPPNDEWKDDEENGENKQKLKLSSSSTREIPFFKGNLLDKSSLEKAFQNADCVIHCASYGMSGQEQLNWDKTEEINIQGTVNALNACVSAGVKAFVYTSTFNVVFGGQEIRNGNEEMDYFPLHRHVDHYSRTKSIAEQLVLMADGKGEGKLRTTALRLAGVIGLKEKRHLPRIVDTFPMLKFVYSHPHSLAQFITIQNVVQAHVKGALTLLREPEKVGGEAFFVSDGIPINNFEFFRPLIEGLGYTFPSLNLPLSFMWIFSRISIMFPSIIPLITPAEIYKSGVTHYFSNEKAERILGYKAIKPNDISDVVKYYQEKRRHEKEQKMEMGKKLTSTNQHSSKSSVQVQSGMLIRFLTLIIFVITILLAILFLI